VSRNAPRLNIVPSGQQMTSLFCIDAVQRLPPIRAFARGGTFFPPWKQSDSGGLQNALGVRQAFQRRRKPFDLRLEFRLALARFRDRLFLRPLDEARI